MARWIDPCGDIVRNIEMTVYRETFRSPIYYNIYTDGLYLLLLFVCPLTTLLYMNIKLAQAIRSVGQQQQKNSVGVGPTNLANNGRLKHFFIRMLFCCFC